MRVCALSPAARANKERLRRPADVLCAQGTHHDGKFFDRIFNFGNVPPGLWSGGMETRESTPVMDSAVQ